MLEAYYSTISKLSSSLDTPAIPWKPVLLSLLTLVYGFEQVLSLRQYALYAKKAPPASLAAHVDDETFTKSQAYGRDKAKFAFVSSAVSHAMSSAVIYFNAYAWAWTKASVVLAGTRWAGKEIPTTLLFLPILSLMREVPLLPLSLYRHFVLEEKHGFNKMTIGTWAADWVKETLVGLVLMCPLVAGLISLMRWAGEAFVAYTVGFLLAFQILAMVLYPTVIQPLFNKLSPLPEGRLRTRVLALAGSLRFPLSKVYVIDGSKRSSHSNAYFFGVIPGGQKHIVLYDSLIEKSTPDEIEAILAHELGHWAHNDPAKLLALSQAQILFTMSLFTLAIHNESLFRAFGFAFAPGTALPIIVGLELFQLALAPCDALLKFVMNACVRRMEYAADAFALTLKRPAPTAEEKADEDKSAEKALSKSVHEDYGPLLCKALVKLHIQNLSTMHHDPLFSAYHYSHPTLAERLHALEERKSE